MTVRGSALRAAVAAASACALSCSSGTGAAGARGAGVDGPLAGQREAPFLVEEARVTVFEGTWPRLTASARQVLLAPMAFGPLEVAQVHELVLTRPRVEVREERGPDGAFRAAPAFLEDPTLGLAALSGLARGLPFYRGRIFDAKWTVLDGDAVVSAFEATEGRIGAGGRELVLFDFAMEQGGGSRRVRARRAVWLPDERAFWIADDFTLQEGSVVSSGKGLLIGVTARART